MPAEKSLSYASAGRFAVQAVGSSLDSCDSVTALPGLCHEALAQGPISVDFTQQDAEFLEWLASADRASAAAELFLQAEL